MKFKIDGPYIVLVDIFWEGHIPYYHKEFIKRFIELDIMVVSISTAVDELQNWLDIQTFTQKDHMKLMDFNSAIVQNRFEAFSLLTKVLTKILYILSSIRLYNNRGAKKFIQVITNWYKINSLVNNIQKQSKRKPEFVFFGYLDKDFIFKGVTGYLIDRIFKYYWTGFYFAPTRFRCSVKIEVKGRIEKIFPGYRIFSSKNLFCVLLSDEGVLVNVEKLYGKSFIWHPEIYDEYVPEKMSKLAMTILNKAKGRKIVSLLGIISDRKGIDLFIEAAIALRGSDVFFLICGPLHNDSNSGKIRERIKLLDEEMSFVWLDHIEGDEYFNELVKLSDIIFIAYKSFYHGSGILSKASYFRKPVIASAEHCIGERVKKYGLGITIDEGNTQQCVLAIKKLMNNEIIFFEEGFLQYSFLNSIENQRNSIHKVLASYHTFVKNLNRKTLHQSV